MHEWMPSNTFLIFLRKNTKTQIIKFRLMEFFGNFFWLKTRVMGTFTQKFSLLIFLSTKYLDWSRYSGQRMRSAWPWSLIWTCVPFWVLVNLQSSTAGSVSWSLGHTERPKFHLLWWPGQGTLDLLQSSPASLDKHWPGGPSGRLTRSWAPSWHTLCASPGLALRWFALIPFSCWGTLPSSAQSIYDHSVPACSLC